MVPTRYFWLRLIRQPRKATRHWWSQPSGMNSMNTITQPIHHYLRIAPTHASSKGPQRAGSVIYTGKRGETTHRFFLDVGAEAKSAGWSSLDWDLSLSCHGSGPLAATNWMERSCQAHADPRMGLGSSFRSFSMARPVSRRQATMVNESHLSSQRSFCGSDAWFDSSSRWRGGIIQDWALNRFDWRTLVKWRDDGLGWGNRSMQPETKAAQWSMRTPGTDSKQQTANMITIMGFSSRDMMSNPARVWYRHKVHSTKSILFIATCEWLKEGDLGSIGLLKSRSIIDQSAETGTY